MMYSVGSKVTSEVVSVPVLKVKVIGLYSVNPGKLAASQMKLKALT